MTAEPTLEVEAALWASGVRYVIGCDEVGRGALAGPVAVGAVVVAPDCGPAPRGLRDSKLLPERSREELAPRCASWVLRSAIGLSSAAEIDRLGIMSCLGLAAARAFDQLRGAGLPDGRGAVLLDGSVDYLSPACPGVPRVHTRIKADRDCACVAAASVIAKVHRDRIMIDADRDAPAYGWARNKGYGSAAHRAAIARLGPTGLHRRTWLSRSGGTDALT